MLRSFVNASSNSALRSSRRYFSSHNALAQTIASLARSSSTMDVKQLRSEHKNLPKTFDEGWATQTEARKLLATSDDVGGEPLRLAGWKVGATSKSVQKMLGISSPFPGPVYQQNLLPSGMLFNVTNKNLFGVECELALVIGQEISAGKSYSESEVRSHIGEVVPAIEIAGSRFTGDVRELGAAVTTADLGGNIALVTGEKRTLLTDDLDMAAVSCKLMINNTQKAEGNGSLVLGSPLTVLTWLANFLSQNGIPIEAGSVISTGTMTGAEPVDAHDNVVADFGPLGAVHVKFLP